MKNTDEMHLTITGALVGSPGRRRRRRREEAVAPLDEAARRRLRRRRGGIGRERRRFAHGARILELNSSIAKGTLKLRTLRIQNPRTIIRS